MSEIPVHSKDSPLSGDVPPQESGRLDLEGWKNLEHSIQFGNGETKLLCYWDGDYFRLSVRLLILGREIESEYYTLPFSHQELSSVRSFFEDITNKPVNIAEQVASITSQENPALTSHIDSRRSSVFAFIKRVLRLSN